MSGSAVVSLHVTTEGGEGTTRALDVLGRVCAGFVLDGLYAQIQAEPIFDENEDEDGDGG